MRLGEKHKAKYILVRMSNNKQISTKVPVVISHKPLLNLYSK